MRVGGARHAGADARAGSDLIDTVVASKVEDGQLDESPLTLGELAIVKHEFVKVLAGVSHRRIEYPGTKHITDADDDGGDDETTEPPGDAG